jgi:hypothetical protein
LIWSTLSRLIVELEEGVIDLNTSRDAVTAGAFAMDNDPLDGDQE